LNVPRELCRKKHRGPGLRLVQALLLFGKQSPESMPFLPFYDPSILSR